MTPRRVCFPLLGSYYVAEKVVGSLVGDEVILPPPITKRTLEIGAKHSPEAVCVPFKYMLGNFIEAVELGANVLVQMGGGCRLGCYGEVHRAILRRLGYDCEYIQVINDHGILSLIRFIKARYPQLSYLHICTVLYLAYEKARAIDIIEDYLRKNVGFVTRTDALERLHQRFLADLDRAATTKEVHQVKQDYEADFYRLDVQKPDKPLRVGFVGEFYVVMEPFSNFFIEKQLARYGVELHRPLTIAGTVQHYTFYNRHIRHLLRQASPYLTHAIGAHGTESVAQAVHFVQQGFDGLIHVKPFGCMPEINAMPALHRVSEDYHFPILYFSFDSLTSETGIKTRLEAFYDMLMMRKVHHA
ncbi:MAG: hypothetical protein IAE80_10805 [Anaerolinea sp.]|nr:hypothetical protein [Anaerolinea sp.]